MLHVTLKLWLTGLVYEIDEGLVVNAYRLEDTQDINIITLDPFPVTLRRCCILDSDWSESVDLG